MPKPQRTRTARANVQAMRLPQRAAITLCTSATDVNANRMPVAAQERSKATSNQSGIGGRARRWMKSVAMYGAFGRKASQMRNHAARANVERTRAKSIAATGGIVARKRFQTRKKYVTVCERAMRSAIKTPHQSSKAVKST